MDGSRFDTWTRRRFGQIAGGVAGAVVGLGARIGAAAKNKKKKKKRRCCVSLRGDCESSEQCCGHPDTICELNECLILGIRTCCRREGASCREDRCECCLGSVCVGGECVHANN